MAKEGMIYRLEKYLIYFYLFITALGAVGLFPWDFVKYAAYGGIPFVSIVAIYLTIVEFSGQGR